jgi:two-component system, chemotaxis family, response regulator WspF
MRIGLVNDITAAVEVMRRVVLSSEEHQVAWVARDGAEALDLCARQTPDLILMDMIMPGMDGVEATRRIMARTPCAIVVVTANVRDNSSKVFDALGAGALDAVNTPVLERPGASASAKALLAKIETIRKLIGAPRVNHPNTPGLQAARQPAEHRDCLVGIGASAGGPTAVAKVLSQLPADFPAPVVVVQHLDAQFAQGLATWLDGQCPLHVRVARGGDRPAPGTALLAGQDAHLEFASTTRLIYSRNPPTHCAACPSIDLFFKSADRFWPGQIVGVLLTGMGRDGAEGLRSLRASGHHTIAQDRASSAVYGMPAAAAELEAASEILGLDKIGPRLRNIVAQKIKAHG